MDSSLVDICLVTWNGDRFLERCLSSLQNQSYANWRLFILDNGSTDRTPSIITSWSNGRDVNIEYRKENSGFATANNELIRLGQAPFVFVLNQDVDLERDYLEKLVETIGADDRLASVSGLLMKMEFVPEGLGRTNVIDAAGFKIYRTHRVVERKRGIYLDKHVSDVKDVFGVPATAALYRRSALDQVAIHRNENNEYFDELFHSYKEDVDLAYRLCLLGWKSKCDWRSVAFHVRGLRGDNSEGALGTRATIAHRSQKKSWQNALSYRNHLLFLASDFFFPVWSSVWWWTVFYETGKFLVLLVTETKSLRVLTELPALVQKERDKRRQLRANHANYGAVERWLT